MDQHGQGQSQDLSQLSHAKNANEVEQLMGNPNQALVLGLSPAHLPVVQTAGAPFAGTLVNSSEQTPEQKRETEVRQRLRTFWDNQIQDIKKMNEFKNHSLPLARIKKIMKADEDVKMISAEAPMVFAKACEMFILELTLRAWSNTEENKRRTLLRSDVNLAIAKTDIFDFLVDIIPREEVRDETPFTMPRSGMSAVSIPVPVPVPDAQTYYHLPPQQRAQPTTTAAETMNRPVLDPNLFREHIPYMPSVFWYPEEQQDQEQQQQQPPPPPRSASES